MTKTQSVRRRPSEKYNEDCVIKTIKHPTSVMIWSVICGKGLGRLYIVNGIMRQQQYTEVLRTRLLPQLRDWFKKEEKPIFMQDGAPCHTAKSVKNFLNSSNVSLLLWPGNSPDLNPIENVWEMLKREVAKDQVTNKVKLIERIIFHWNHNQHLKDMSLRCIDSMPRRVQAVIAAKGGLTKY